MVSLRRKNSRKEATDRAATVKTGSEGPRHRKTTKVLPLWIQSGPKGKWHKILSREAVATACGFRRGDKWGPIHEGERPPGPICSLAECRGETETVAVTG